MKEIFIFLTLFSVIFFSGCLNNTAQKKTSYQIKNDLTKDTTSYSRYYYGLRLEKDFDDGTLYEIIVYCFNSDDEIVYKDFLGNIKPGSKSKKFIVSDEIVRIKVSYKDIPYVAYIPNNYGPSEYLNRRSVNVYYYKLSKGKCTSISIRDTTLQWPIYE